MKNKIKRAIRLKDKPKATFLFESLSTAFKKRITTRSNGKAVLLLPVDQDYRVTNEGNGDVNHITVAAGKAINLSHLTDQSRAILTRGMLDGTRGLIDGDNFSAIDPSVFGTIDVYGTLFHSRTQQWEGASINISLVELLLANHGGLAIPTSSKEETVESGRVSFTIFADALYSIGLPDGSQYLVRTPSADHSPIPINRLLDEYSVSGVISEKLTPLGDLVIELDRKLSAVSSVKSDLDAFTGDFAYKIEVVLPEPDKNGDTVVNLGDLFDIAISGINWEDVISIIGEAFAETELGSAITSELEPRIEELEHFREATLEGIGDLEAKTQALESNEEALTNSISSFASELVDVNLQLTTLGASLNDGIAEIESAKERLAPLEISIAEASSNLTELTVDVQRLDVGQALIMPRLQSLEIAGNATLLRLQSAENAQQITGSRIESLELTRTATGDHLAIVDGRLSALESATNPTTTQRTNQSASQSDSQSASQSASQSDSQSTNSDLEARLSTAEAGLVSALSLLGTLTIDAQWSFDRIKTLEDLLLNESPANPATRTTWYDLTSDSTYEVRSTSNDLVIDKAYGEESGLTGWATSQWREAFMLQGFTVERRQTLSAIFKLDHHASPSFFIGVVPTDITLPSAPTPKMYEKACVCLYISPSESHYFYGKNNYRQNVTTKPILDGYYYHIAFTPQVDGGIRTELKRLLQNDPSFVSEVILDVSGTNSSDSTLQYSLYIVPSMDPSWVICQVGITEA